tara:strand:- start:2070 stop:3233 length:1164 start_codon:yes stop_codon:yes gene_type:complete
MKSISIFFCLIVLSIGNINLNAKAEIINDEVLKVGLIVPLSGKYGSIGKSILNSLRIALNKIDDNKIAIYPRDNQADPEKTLLAGKELSDLGVSIIIGPIFHENLKYVENLNNILFLTLSNKDYDLPSNVIATGINAKSQLDRIILFLKKENLSKTIVLIPKSENESELKKYFSKVKFKFSNIYSYDTNPEKLTKQIELITKYKERKYDLNRRIKILEKSELEEHKRELEKLKTKDTIGSLNFDSVIIADFDQSLKSVVTSFLYADVDYKRVKLITLNQWFDETLFKENSTNNIYFPSVNYKNYTKFRETYFINYNKYPNNISIIAYDIFGLIYYMSKKNKKKLNIDSFFKKNKFSGNVGQFEINKNLINYKLNLYQVSRGKFKLIN